MVLPFQLGETDGSGIFDYRFAIERRSPGERVLLERQIRKAVECTGDVFATFQPDPSNQLFQRWTVGISDASGISEWNCFVFRDLMDLIRPPHGATRKSEATILARAKLLQSQHSISSMEQHTLQLVLFDNFLLSSKSTITCILINFVII